MTTPITIEEIDKALKVLRKTTFPEHVWYAADRTYQMLAQFRDALVSGEYALISKADREKAIEAARNCGHLEIQHIECHLRNVVRPEQHEAAGSDGDRPLHIRVMRIIGYLQDQLAEKGSR